MYAYTRYLRLNRSELPLMFFVTDEYLQDLLVMMFVKMYTSSLFRLFGVSLCIFVL